MKKPRTIFLSVCHGFVARTLLRSGILDSLKKDGHRIVILTPNANEEYFVKEFADKNVYIRKLHHKWGRFEGYFQLLWEHATATRQVSDKVVELERIRKERPLRYFLLKSLNALCSNNRVALGLWRWLDRACIRDKYHAAIFQEFRPDLLVITSHGFQAGDLMLLRQAKAQGVRTLYVVLSWDNPTTYGIMRERPDRIIVWNEMNKEEIVSLHGYPENHVYVSGPPPFDIYARAKEFNSWPEYAQRMSLDPERKLILLAGTVIETTDGFDDVAAFLAESVEQNRFVSPCQLLIRPHPLVYSGWFKGQGTKEDVTRYRRLGKYVFCDEPRVLSTILKADRAGTDAKHLAESFYHASVLVNFFSSVTLEGCATDTPVVEVAFDGFQKRDYYHSVTRIVDLDCIQKLIRLNGFRIARTPEELIQLINQYLANPSLDSEGRKRTAQAFFYRLDGRAAERAARCISLFAQGVWPPNG